MNGVPYLLPFPELEGLIRYTKQCNLIDKLLNLVKIISAIT